MEGDQKQTSSFYTTYKCSVIINLLNKFINIKKKEKMKMILQSMDLGLI